MQKMLILYPLLLYYEDTCIERKLSFLPTWIAEPGDIVIVDSVERAGIFRDSMYNKVKKKVGEGVCFASFKEPFKNVCSRLSIDVDNAELAPWGWDGYIKRKFEKWGVPQSMLPTDEELEGIRNLSSRRVAVKMLPLVADAIGRDFCVGESFVITSLEEFFPLAEKYEGVMMKMPWSSSGKGLNYCYSTNITEKVKGWITNVIEKQGCCIVEPLYNKFGDYALEFKVSEGKVSFLGYSKFDTANQGTYQGNVLMTDKEIEDYMCYILGVDVDKIPFERSVCHADVMSLRDLAAVLSVRRGKPSQQYGHLGARTEKPMDNECRKIRYPLQQFYS